MAESGAERFGKLYWCIKTYLSNDGQIYTHADRVQIDQTGCLLFFGRHRDGGPEYLTLALAAGSWRAVYMASLFDGSPVAVERWAGEVIN